MSITRHIQSVLRDNPGRSWNDLVHSTLLQRLPATTGTVSDLWMQWLNSRGYPYSSLSDMLQAYWNRLNVPTEERNYFTLGWFELFSTPLPLFSNGEQGAWYDPSDMSTLFQDSAGTTPVTALGQPVGLILDKSRGLVLGPELRATGTTQLAGTATAASYNTSTGAGTVHRGADVSNQSFIQFSGLTAGTTYILRLSSVSGTAAGVAVRQDGAAGIPVGTVSNGTTASIYATAPASGILCLTTSGANNVNTTFTLESIRTIAGNHLTQTTAASRPLWQQDANGAFHLTFDGVDDFLTIGTFNMSASDKVTVCAGVRKLSDAARAVVVELGNASAAQIFRLEAPNSVAGNNYNFASGGSILTNAVTPGSFASPVTNVVTSTADIAADSIVIRVNSVQSVTGSSDQGTGNYAAAQPLFVGRRGGSGLPFNGNLYGLVIRGTAATTPQIASLERYMAQKTGIPA